ncbi:diguanylate cyclase [Shimia abyssi]|nr:diguanylate cyclase [Shimia abyssi]
MSSNSAQLFEILNQMEQGIVAWSPDGVCRLHNDRIFRVLELNTCDLRVGMSREQFLKISVSYGVISQAKMDEVQGNFKSGQPFHFDRNMPSGRVVSSFARPLMDGGYVVTFTDVTQFRRDAADLDKAKKAAEAAETKALALLAKEQAWRSEGKLLAQLDEWLQSCKSLDELFEVVRRFMPSLLPCTDGELYLYSNSRDVLDGSCTWGEAKTHDHIAPDSCWALRRGRGYHYDASGAGLECQHMLDAADGIPEIENAICVPIVAHGDTVGLLHVVYPAQMERRRVLEANEFALQCGEHISLAIANVKLRDELHDQSTRGPLTRLYNRRYFLEALRSDGVMAARKDESFALLAFDADKFKSFNDNHGHDAGDMVLRAISDKMLDMFAKGETPCRFGGEEFSVLVPKADTARGLVIAEKLRAAVEEVQVRYGAGELPRVTISIGVASYPADGTMPQDLIKAADKALYAAKAAGRNCVRAAADVEGKCC